MAKIKGTVSNTGEGKFSKFIMLEERDGFYFNTKFEPKCGKGDVVGIEYEQKGDTRGNIKKIVVLEDNGGAAASSSDSWDDTPAPSKGATPASNNRQDSIVWQSARKCAVPFVAALLAAEAFKPTGKADAKRTQIENLLDEVTYRFFTAAADPRNSEAFKTNTKIDEDAAEPEEDDAKDGDWDEWE